MKFCQRCGAQNDDNVAYCTSCGAAIEMQEVQPQNEYFQPADIQPNYNQPNYGQPVYGQTSYGSPVLHRAVQTDRSLFIYIILTIITCGIYGYYFIHKLAKDTNTMCFEDGDKTSGLGMYILLNIVTCGFYSYYWLYKIQNRYCTAAQRYGFFIPETGGSVLLWNIFGVLLCGIGPFIAMNIVITSANKVGTVYNMKYVYYNR